MVLTKLFPPTLDNQYQGQKLALWLLGFMVLLKGGMGLNSLFNGYHVATVPDGIPLEAWPPAAANAVVSFLSVWGLEMFLISLLGVLALVRYRAMVPLMFLLLLVEQIGRKAVFTAIPIAKSGTPPAVPINWVICGLLVLGLVLSLWPRKVKVSS